MKGVFVYLVAWEYQGVGNDNVFSPSSSKDDDFSNIVWSQGLATTTGI